MITILTSIVVSSQFPFFVREVTIGHLGWQVVDVQTAATVCQLAWGLGSASISFTCCITWQYLRVIEYSIKYSIE